CVSPFRYGVDLIERQPRLMRHDGLDRIEGCVNRTIAFRLSGVVAAINLKGDGRLLWAASSGNHSERQHLDAVMRRRNFLTDKSLISSSKTCFFRSARSFKRWKASSKALSPSS